MKLWKKNILSMLVIVGGGYGLFMVAFMSAALVMNIYNMIFKLFSDRPGVNDSAMHPSGSYVYLILILLFSWFVFRSRLKDLAKATFLTMPMMVVLMVVGLSLYPQSNWIITGIGAMIVGVILFYLYKTKRSWMYYFATIYVVAVALFVMLSGMEI